MRSAREVGVPVLGICYGAQVMAHALGGQVEQAASPEVGWIEVDSAEPAQVPSGPWLAFHVDVVAPPPGAHAVARAQCGVQAFSLPGLLAVQFPSRGPVGRAGRLGGSLSRGGIEAGLDPAAVLAETRHREAEARAAAHDLVDAFLDRIAAPATNG